MKALKNHPLPYNTLSRCLEAHFGDERAAVALPTRPRYREPDQGFRTVLFKSRPLQLDHMRRRKEVSRGLRRLTQISGLFK